MHQRSCQHYVSKPSCCLTIVAQRRTAPCVRPRMSATSSQISFFDELPPFPAFKRATAVFVLSYTNSNDSDRGRVLSRY